MKKLIILFLVFLTISCEFERINYLVPIVTTSEPESVLSNSAVLGGSVLGEGGKDVTEFGIVWSKNFPPTINDNKSIEGQRLGEFSRLYDNLESKTTYYVAAYAISEVGVGYGGIYEITTNSEAPCNPPVDNYMDLGREEIVINEVIKQDPTGFNDGNVEIIANYGYWPQIILQFNEKDKELPRTGEYTCVYEFNNQSIRSNGEVKISISDFSIGSLGGGPARVGQKIYVKNDENKVEFIFCDVLFGDQPLYELTGKFFLNP